jgi:predicted amidohydrolase YtcJ
LRERRGLLANGRIDTLDAAGTIADTLVRDGRAAFVGRRARGGSEV